MTEGQNIDKININKIIKSSPGRKDSYKID